MRQEPPSPPNGTPAPLTDSDHRVAEYTASMNAHLARHRWRDISYALILTAVFGFPLSDLLFDDRYEAPEAPFATEVFNPTPGRSILFVVGVGVVYYVCFRAMRARRRKQWYPDPPTTD